MEEIKKDSNDVNEILDYAITKVGSRNKLAGILDITTQQFQSYRMNNCVSVKAALKLEHITGIPWQRWCPEFAKELNDLPQY